MTPAIEWRVLWGEAVTKGLFRMSETDQERTAREWLNALGAEKDADAAVASAMAKLESTKSNTLKAYEAMKLAFSAEPPQSYAAARGWDQANTNTNVDMTDQIVSHFNETYGFTGLGQSQDPIRYDPD